MKDRIPPRKPKLPVQSVKAEEFSPEEIAAMEERYRKYDHNHTVILNVLDDLAHPYYGGKRDLVGVIVGLMAHLTPEQALSLAEKLPSLLPSGARPALAQDGILPVPEPAATP